jgi:hypothetical protein
MIRIASHPCGPRLYIVGLRVHHGIGGAVLAAGALAVHRPRLAVGLALWAATDYRDFPFTDQCNHGEGSGSD